MATIQILRITCGLAILLGLAILFTPAYATNSSISPTSLAGGSNTTLAIRVTNSADSTSTADSVIINIPSGWAVSIPSVSNNLGWKNESTLDPPQIRLTRVGDSSSLYIGESMTVTFNATAPSPSITPYVFGIKLFQAPSFGGVINSATPDTVSVTVQSPTASKPRTVQMNLPAHVLEAIKPKIIEPVGKLEVTTMNGGKEIITFPEKIVIKNAGNRTVDNIRIMLSPEISKSFRLSDPSIMSIQPNANVTVALELNGSPNRDVAGNLVGYNGKLIVMAEHHSPITISVNIGSQQSDSLHSYMDRVASKAEQRYNKISLLNSILSKKPEKEYGYEVTTSHGNGVITDPSEELVIRNLGEKQLKNVRIHLLNAGHVLLLEQKNILSLEPNGQATIKLIPKFDIAKYSPRDIRGELLIVPSNDNPIQITINIAGAERKDSAEEFVVRTISGSNTISKAVDVIAIKNTANRTMDSVKIMLSHGLARIFSLSEESFQSIKPGDEVQVKYTARDPKTLMQNFEGELIVVSEHHNRRSMSISIKWEETSSQHFIVFARSEDKAVAEQLTDFLEANYLNLTSRLGEMKTKTIIYAVGSMEEMSLISPYAHPYYSYMDDTIFVCSCKDVNGDALKKFIYRLVINNYPTYFNMEKFLFDKENWLLDGVTSYLAANITATVAKQYEDAFASAGTSFQWYGYGSDAQYGAVHSFLEFLESKYGNTVVDKSLGYLRSGMISNHRCLALEECAVLRAVYDMIGLDLDNKRNTLSFKNLIEEWEQYVQDRYGVSVIN